MAVKAVIEIYSLYVGVYGFIHGNSNNNGWI